MRKTVGQLPNFFLFYLLLLKIIEAGKTSMDDKKDLNVII
jgi:hypothetical protein